MAVQKSSFSRALKPNLLNQQAIEMLVCILISISILIASVKKNSFFQNLKFNVVSFSKPLYFPLLSHLKFSIIVYSTLKNYLILMKRIKF